jgi:hypothetical protein
MPIPDFYIGHLVTPRANDIYGKKTADGPPDNAYSGFFYWPFGHAKSQ